MKEEERLFGPTEEDEVMQEEGITDEGEQMVNVMERWDSGLKNMSCALKRASYWGALAEVEEMRVSTRVVYDDIAGQVRWVNGDDGTS